MSAGDVAAAALWVANFEGPYHIDPRDPGGATAWGLAVRYHPELASRLPTLSVDEAAAILATQYWPQDAEELPPVVCTPLLAFSVLEGPTAAAQTLQRALGVAVDGHIGPQTAAAATRLEPAVLLLNFFRACMEHLHEKPGWPLNGVGWECRQFSASVAALSR